MFTYLICYLGSLKAKQLICFRFVGGHFGFGHLVELAHTFGRDTPAHVLEYFSDIKSTFKPLSPYNGHGFTIIFLYYMTLSPVTRNQGFCQYIRAIHTCTSAFHNPRDLGYCILTMIIIIPLMTSRHNLMFIRPGHQVPNLVYICPPKGD